MTPAQTLEAAVGFVLVVGGVAAFSPAAAAIAAGGIILGFVVLSHLARRRDG